MGRVKMARERNEKVWEEIRKKVEELKYGNVIITIHDGRIVQVETSTKQRFD
ncbi:YezD family protein [Butyrivibrio sp. VCD2006]|uniref:YezD family protein n=1 Tax=Butyrivibrio sp. VCD2006 TaxID=1280664 RepID=UPI0009DBA12F|nr:YezD family protein [Butyrivibrio sp. VCD2006]